MKNSKVTIGALYSVIGLLSLIGVIIVIRRTILLVPVLINGYHAIAISSRFAQMDDIFAQSPVLTLIHIIPGLVFIVLGPFQCMQNLRTRFPRWHRVSGPLFLAGGMITGITALVMSFAMPAIGGVNQAAATILFSLFLLYSLLKAFQQAKQRKTATHREWAIRAYAIGLAIASIRIINGIFFATSSFTHLTPHDFFGIGFWIGFVVHLILAEVWINKTRQVKTKVIVSGLSKDPFIECKSFNN